MKPRQKENWINQDELVRRINAASKTQMDDIAAAVVHQQELLISALKKKKEGKPLTDEEQAARLDAATRGINWNQTRQDEALDVYKTQMQNQYKSDLARDKAIRVGRQYE